jgi:hypothetical protein
MTTPNDDQPALYSCAKTGCLHNTLAVRIEALIAERDAAVAQTDRAIANGWQGIENASNAMVQVAKRYHEGIAEGERRATAAIVAWLRDAADKAATHLAPDRSAVTLLVTLADGFERGDHLKAPK